MIPPRLQHPNFRFCLINKKEKGPHDNSWQTPGLQYNDPKLQAWLAAGNNYGVIGGYNNLIMIDWDDEEARTKIMPQLPETFTIKTGSGKYHQYFYSQDANTKSYKVFIDKKMDTLADIQGSGKQCVGPGSTHPNGQRYEVFLDKEIATVNYGELKALFEPWLDQPQIPRAAKEIANVDVAKIKSLLKVSDLLKENNIQTNRNPTSCPFHNSKGGKCFSYTDEVWHCFHCDKSGDVITLYQEIKRIDFKEAIKRIKEEKGIKEEKKTFKKKDEEEQKYYTSFLEDGETIYEEIYDEGIVRFARYNKETQTIDYVDSIEKEDKTIMPIMGEEITKGAIYLPSKAEEYNTDEELDNEIKSFIHTWLDIPEDKKQFALWNIKRSWVYERFHSLNYLHALGDTGQGKSRFLATLGHLHYKPIFASGATTSAPVFRIIDKWRGTMIFDECDLKVSDETADIIKIINQGYEKGTFVMRCDQNDASKLLFFDPFCPKIIATRKPFTDKAVASRCITTVMMGTNRKDIKFTLTEEFYKQSKIIRNKLLMWRFKNYDKIDTSKTFDVNFDKFEPRVQQIVTSYIAMFGSNESLMKSFKEFVNEFQEGLIEERANSWLGSIVQAIYELYHDQGKKDIDSGDIINQGNLTDTEGKPLKPRSLTRHLTELGFGKTIRRKVNGKDKRCIPLLEVHLENIFKRYGLRDEGYDRDDRYGDSTKKNIDQLTLVDTARDDLAGSPLESSRSYPSSPLSEETKETVGTIEDESLDVVEENIFDGDKKDNANVYDKVYDFIKNNQGIDSLSIQKSCSITYDVLLKMQEQGLIFQSPNDCWNII